MEKHKRDLSLRGTAQLIVGNMTNCEKINCSKLKECSQKHIKDIRCIYPVPLIQKKFYAPVQENLVGPNQIHNATGKTFLTNLCKLITGTHGALVYADFLIKYASLSTNIATPSSTSSMTLEKARVAITDLTINDSKITCKSNFPSGTGTTATTTISSVTSTTVFVLTDATNFGIGEGIKITKADGNYYHRTITNKSGSTITIDVPVTGLASGNTVNEVLGNLYLIAGGTLTGLNTDGVAVSLYPVNEPITKTSAEVFSWEHTLELIEG